ncbi:MAG: hypothetical protein MRY83_04760, partial [Flavobacteriales bacterium]|nr:hypothetical protein [Flavobacteriales bacterium]
KLYAQSFPDELKTFLASDQLKKVPKIMKKFNRIIDMANNDTLFESDTLAAKIKINLGDNYVMAYDIENKSPERTAMLMNSEVFEEDEDGYSYSSLSSSSNEDFLESLQILSDTVETDLSNLEKWGYDFTNKTENLKVLQYRLKELDNLKYLIVQRDLLKMNPEVSNDGESDYEGGFLIGQTYLFDFETEELINSYSFTAQSSETITYTDYGSYTNIGSKIQSDFEANIKTSVRSVMNRYFDIDGSMPY